ncbi:unnamed protein product [Amoebophrya sp. A120]|nr:unnamed protein product [Amoebophrya sp. A120]|eukprot:GSA120T00010365001.1
MSHLRSFASFFNLLGASQWKSAAAMPVICNGPGSTGYRDLKKSSSDAEQEYFHRAPLLASNAFEQEARSFVNQEFVRRGVRSSTAGEEQIPEFCTPTFGGQELGSEADGFMGTNPDEELDPEENHPPMVLAGEANSHRARAAHPLLGCARRNQRALKFLGVATAVAGAISGLLGPNMIGTTGGTNSQFAARTAGQEPCDLKSSSAGRSKAFLQPADHNAASAAPSVVDKDGNLIAFSQDLPSPKGFDSSGDHTYENLIRSGKAQVLELVEKKPKITYRTAEETEALAKREAAKKAAKDKDDTVPPFVNLNLVTVERKPAGAATTRQAVSDVKKDIAQAFAAAEPAKSAAEDSTEANASSSSSVAKQEKAFLNAEAHTLASALTDGVENLFKDSSSSGKLKVEMEDGQTFKYETGNMKGKSTQEDSSSDETTSSQPVASPTTSAPQKNHLRPDEVLIEGKKYLTVHLPALDEAETETGHAEEDLTPDEGRPKAEIGSLAPLRDITDADRFIQMSNLPPTFIAGPEPTVGHQEVPNPTEAVRRSDFLNPTQRFVLDLQRKKRLLAHVVTPGNAMQQRYATPEQVKQAMTKADPLSYIEFDSQDVMVLPDTPDNGFVSMSASLVLPKSDPLDDGMPFYSAPFVCPLGESTTPFAAADNRFTDSFPVGGGPQAAGMSTTPEEINIQTLIYGKTQPELPLSTAQANTEAAIVEKQHPYYMQYFDADQCDVLVTSNGDFGSTGIASNALRYSKNAADRAHWLEELLAKRIINPLDSRFAVTMTEAGRNALFNAKDSLTPDERSRAISYFRNLRGPPTQQQMLDLLEPIPGELTEVIANCPLKALVGVADPLQVMPKVNQDRVVKAKMNNLALNMDDFFSLNVPCTIQKPSMTEGIVTQNLPALREVDGENEGSAAGASGTGAFAAV